MTLLALSWLFLTTAHCLAGPEGKAADYVFTNGKIYTLNPAQPWAGSVAFKGNKIVAVGSDSETKAWIVQGTKVVDLRGRMLMPGFIDGHNHFISGAAGKRGVRLVDSKNTRELLRPIAAYVKANPQREYYTGYGWEFPMFGKNEGTRQELDSVCSDKPMMLFNEDNHHTWFNTKAMEITGITRTTTDKVPGCSFFRREPDGTPCGMAIEPDTWIGMAIMTGIMGGNDMLQDIVAMVFPLIPGAGITATHDMGIWAPDLPQGYRGFELILGLEKDGKLPCRFVGVYGIRDATASPVESVALLKEWSLKYHSGMVQVTGLKIWADGTFLSHTGAELLPYADKPDTRGESNWTSGVLARWIETAYSNGFDVNIHTDGDAAVRRSLDSVEMISKKPGFTERLTTLHHITTIHPDDILRFRKLGVGGNYTPVWLVDYKDQYKEAIRILGKERVDKEYGLAKKLIGLGVNVTFGSDIPGTDVEELSPLFQIQAAVTGRVPGFTNGLVPPKDRLPSLEQMLYGYTLAGARQIRMEDKIGSIETGKLADLVILEKNLFEVKPEEISRVRVLFTMMDGKITNDENSLK